jgi:hypothetical protein
MPDSNIIIFDLITLYGDDTTMTSSQAGNKASRFDIPRRTSVSKAKQPPRIIPPRQHEQQFDLPSYKEKYDVWDPLSHDDLAFTKDFDTKELPSIPITPNKLKDLNDSLARALSKYSFPTPILPGLLPTRSYGSNKYLKPVEVRSEYGTFVWDLLVTIKLATFNDMVGRKLSMSRFEVLDSKLRVITCDKQLQKSVKGGSRLLIKRVDSPFRNSDAGHR